jgi:CopG family nickel-responsive transcriptional regulator
MPPKTVKGNRIVSMSLPVGMLTEMDKVSEDAGYSSRSEFVRDAVRSFLRERAEVAGLRGHVNGIIILVYDHGAAAKVSEVRHRHMCVFKSFMHADFDGGDDCCEVLMFCGEANMVRESYDRLATIVGVKETRLFLA